MSEELQQIHHCLEHYKEDKWGWVIYRTTYKDDEGWERFKQHVNAQLQKELLQSDEVPPSLLKARDWIFVSDKATLDGAHKQELRYRFREWRDTAVQVGNPRRDSGDKELSQRYTFFIRVDEASLKSVLKGLDAGDTIWTGWVHLIRCNDRCDFERPRDHKGEDLDWNASGNPDQEDDGWTMIASDMIGIYLYAHMDLDAGIWKAFYAPPPDVVMW
jgi:hypothetical protein